MARPGQIGAKGYLPLLEKKGEEGPKVFLAPTRKGSWVTNGKGWRKRISLAI